MEQYEDIKNELQQELQDLQQNVDQHSTFNREVWQRAVKRYSRHLYRQTFSHISCDYICRFYAISNMALVDSGSL